MEDVIIVGGGVAAFTSALFLGRRGLKVLVLGKDVGGQANFTDTIENFPGFEQIGGFELVSKIRVQSEKWGIRYIEAEVDKVKAVEGGFITSAYGNQYKSKAVILAFGKTPMDLNVPGESGFKGRGVSYCATCDAPLYKGKVVAVAGVGDPSLDAILLCAKYCTRVYALSKTDKLLGHPALTRAVSRKSNVELVPFVQIQDITGGDSIQKLRLHDLTTGKVRDLAVDGLFVELGYVVNSGFVKDLVELDESGQIVVGKNQETSCAGVFAAGDATHSDYKQAVISAGEAAKAALACYDYLAKMEGRTGLTSDWTQIKRIK